MTASGGRRFSVYFAYFAGPMSPMIGLSEARGCLQLCWDSPCHRLVNDAGTQKKGLFPHESQKDSVLLEAPACGASFYGFGEVNTAEHTKIPDTTGNMKL